MNRTERRVLWILLLLHFGSCLVHGSFMPEDTPAGVRVPTPSSVQLFLASHQVRICPAEVGLVCEGELTLCFGSAVGNASVASCDEELCELSAMFSNSTILTEEDESATPSTPVGADGCFELTMGDVDNVTMNETTCNFWIHNGPVVVSVQNVPRNCVLEFPNAVLKSPFLGFISHAADPIDQLQTSIYLTVAIYVASVSSLISLYVVVWLWPIRLRRVPNLSRIPLPNSSLSSKKLPTSKEPPSNPAASVRVPVRIRSQTSAERRREMEEPGEFVFFDYERIPDHLGESAFDSLLRHRLILLEEEFVAPAKARLDSEFNVRVRRELDWREVNLLVDPASVLLSQMDELASEAEQSVCAYGFDPKRPRTWPQTTRTLLSDPKTPAFIVLTALMLDLRPLIVRERLKVQCLCDCSFQLLLGIGLSRWLPNSVRREALTEFSRKMEDVVARAKSHQLKGFPYPLNLVGVAQRYRLTGGKLTTRL